METAERAGPGAAAHRGRDALVALALVALGAWEIGVPYLAAALGLELDVPSRVEVVDHVVPGLVLVASGALLAFWARRGARGGVLPLVLASLAFLAGFWITATHVPLVLQAGDELSPWGSVLFHATGGPPIVALALWLLVPRVRALE